MKKIIVLASIVMSVVMMGTVRPAAAIPTLTLSDGTITGTVSITDGGIGDINPLAGIVTYSGSVGTNFIANVSTGLTQPLIGSATSPELDLNSVNVSSISGGTLTITWFDDAFGPVPASSSMVTEIGGTTQGTITLQSYLDGMLIDSLGPYSGGAFSGTVSSAVSPGTPFSLALVATITHGSGVQMTSFDAIASVPEPSSLLLLGSGLVGLGLFGRRKKIAC